MTNQKLEKQQEELQLLINKRDEQFAYLNTHDVEDDSLYDEHIQTLKDISQMNAQIRQHEKDLASEIDDSIMVRTEINKFIMKSSEKSIEHLTHALERLHREKKFVLKQLEHRLHPLKGSQEKLLATLRDIAKLNDRLKRLEHAEQYQELDNLYARLQKTEEMLFELDAKIDNETATVSDKQQLYSLRELINSINSEILTIQETYKIEVPDKKGESS